MWRGELRPTWALAFPIIVGNLSQMLIALADTVMIGRVGTVELGAAAFANAIVHLLFVVGLGIATAVAVQVAQAHGRKDDVAAGEALRHGLLLAVVSGAILAFFLSRGMPFYRLLGQPAEVLDVSPPYLNWVAWSLVPALAGMCFKNFAEAKSSPWIVLWITLGGVFLNILLNWILIFGRLGSPALGIEGAGLATFIARAATLAGLAAYVLAARPFASSRPARWFTALRKSELAGLLTIGIPMGLQMLVEMGAFIAATILIGTFGPIPLAAHQIAINCAATTFMVPLGLSTALTIRVGHALGATEISRARHIVTGALLSAIAFMSSTALLFTFAGRFLAAGFTPDPVVVALSVQLLIIAGFFQIGDGVQIIAMGALRGLKDVRTPTWLVAFIYWLIALPFGAFLAFRLDFGARGMWTGLATGLALASAVLAWRTYSRLRHIEGTADPR